MKVPFIFVLFLSLFFTSCQNMNSEKTNKDNSSKKNVDSSKVIYSYSIDNKPTEIPDDFFVMEGVWSIRKLVNTYALHLQPLPLRAYTMLFGPELKEGLELSVDVYTSKRGRVYPNFSIGSHGLSGFRLNARTGEKGSLIELFTNETRLVANAPCTWQTDMWHTIKMRIVKQADGNVKISGKLWKRGEKEPEWQLNYSAKMDLDEGQCSIWGIPYSGRDIFFDNLIISKP
ncbi:MAG: hypothetical protein NE330_23915 [Lentisphaeraceae bacterium]|nr:hypothetical protein [Lentisphaeraceae bacterium]